MTIADPNNPSLSDIKMAASRDAGYDDGPTDEEREADIDGALALFRAYSELPDDGTVPEHLRQTPRRVAFHEAGHAVVAVVLGQAVNWISIAGFADGARGRVETVSPEGEDPLTTIIVRLSGNPAGELSGDPIHPGVVDDEADEQIAAQEARDRFGAQADAMLAKARERARDLIAEHAAAIERLAVELLERITIEGHDEIAAIVNGQTRSET